MTSNAGPAGPKTLNRREAAPRQRVLILGGDGYLGWPTAMHLAARGHEVLAVDNYARRAITRETGAKALFAAPELDARAAIFAGLTGRRIGVEIGDLRDYSFARELVRRFRPDTVIHYAEQPSAPYSMMGYEQAAYTLDNNLKVTLNIAYVLREVAPACHLIKLGTMGEYGTPNIDIEEGWLDVEHKGRQDRFLYPRQGGSLYHTTKILDTDLLWFFVRTYGLRVTDLMQGPVYGIETAETALDARLLPQFHYDGIFGTVVNRFLVQAIAEFPLTIYGSGGQTRGYINLRDTLACVELALVEPTEPGKLRILNQFTETFSVREVAARVQAAAAVLGLTVSVQRVDNPRLEKEEHYFRAANSGLLELGLEPIRMSTEVLTAMLETIGRYRDGIDETQILPKVRWT